MQFQNRSDRDEAEQPLERASLQELRVRRASPVPNARDAYDELRQEILRLLTAEIGKPRLQEGVAARAFIQAQLDEILRREKIILNRHEKRRLSHDIAASLLASAPGTRAAGTKVGAAQTGRLDSFFSPGGSSANTTRLLRTAVGDRKNILITGKDGAGKTALLRALCFLIPEQEVVITIEQDAVLQEQDAVLQEQDAVLQEQDAVLQEQDAVLQLERPHLVSLCTAGTGDGALRGVTARNLVEAAVRVRHDRLIVNPLEGAEAYHWLQAVSGALRSGMATCTAGSPQDALARLEAMILLSEAPPAAGTIRSEIETGIDLILHLECAPGAPPRVVLAGTLSASDKGQFQIVSID